MLRFSRSGSFRLSKCPVYTCAHIKYWSNWRVCTCVYKHTPTHHPNTRRNREMYKTNPLSLPLSKHSLPRQQLVLSMNKLEKTPTSNRPPHTHASVGKTPVIHTHIVEGLDSKNKQNAPTRVHMYTHTCGHIHIYAYIYTDTHTYILVRTHAHAPYTRMHAHTCTHTCTCTPIHRHKISATTPRRVKQYHRRTYASIIYICMHIHIYMHIHICAHPAVNVSQLCTLMSQEHLYNAYNCTCTGAQKTGLKRTQHPLQKNAHIYIHTRICIRIHMHQNTQAHL